MTKKNCNRIKVKATSLTALLVSVLILSALAGVQFIGKVSAIDYTEYTGTLGDADWVLRIPDPWNGMLVLGCRGYWGSTTIPNAITAIMGVEGTAILNEGYAVAASNYGAAGLCISEAVDSTYEVTTYLIDNYDVTGKVFLIGFSMGGGVALLLGEKYPDVYSGVLDMYGVKDLKDLQTLSQRWSNLTDEELEAELTALGIPVPPPGFSLTSLRSFMAMAIADTELATGGTPETHPEAYEDRSPTYHANIEIPVITLHGTADPLVPHYQSIMYKNAVAQAGKAHLYRLYNITGAGHGTSDIGAEAIGHFNELVAWSDFLTGGLTDWPMFGHGTQRTRYTESPAPNTNRTLWTYPTGGGVSSPAVVDGKVYIAPNDHNDTMCLDAATGEWIWNFTMGDTTYSSPAVVDGKVYVGSYDDNVYCLDAETGTKIWNYTTGGDVFGSPAVADGKVCMCSYDGNLYCLDAINGAKIWNYTVGEGTDSEPAVVDGKVYVGSIDCNVYCLDAVTGAKIWNYTTGGNVFAGPAVSSGRVYVGSFDDEVYCLDAATGALIWNYTTGGDIYSSAAVAYGKVYVCSFDGNVYCLDALTGAQIWNSTNPAAMVASPAVADGKVYVADWTVGRVYCLDATTGALIWSYKTGGWIASSFAVANGVVYINSYDGVLYAFSDLDAPIPEGLTVGVMLLLSTVAAIVGIRCLQKRPKWKRW